MFENLLYSLAKFLLRPLVPILPVELVHRHFHVLPGRLIIDILRWYGADIGENVRILPPVVFDNWSGDKRPFHHLRIGKNTNIGRNAFIDLQGQLVIEGNSTIAMGVMFLTHTNVGDIPLQRVIPKSSGIVTVREGVYIGARATIIASVEIGEHAVVGAGSLVVKDVPARTIHVGVPAKQIRRIDDLALSVETPKPDSSLPGDHTTT